MKTLVLGANGHIGSNLVRVLIGDGRQVRGFVRPGSDRRALRDVSLELFEGDVRDRDKVDRAMQGVDRVFHLAAPTIETPEVMQVALEGTRNVLESARAHGADRVVYTSSVVTLGYTSDPGRPVTEESFAKGDTTPYQAAKCCSEVWLRDFVRVSTAPEVVIVKPATTVGPLDFRPTPANRTIVEFMKKGSAFVFDAGLTITDVEDVARGHLLADRRGRSGESYILGGEPMKIVDLFGTVAALTGRRHPPLRFPRWLMIALAAGLEAGSLVTRRPPLMTIRQASRFVGHYGFYSSDKAERELGYTSRPGAEALARTVSWFLASDLLSARHKRFLAKRMPNA